MPSPRSTLSLNWWRTEPKKPCIWYRVDLPNRRAAKIKEFQGEDIDDLAEAIKIREQLPCPASALVIKIMKHCLEGSEEENASEEIEVDEYLLKEHDRDLSKLMDAYGINNINPFIIKLPPDEYENIYRASPYSPYSPYESSDFGSSDFSDRTISDYPDPLEIPVDLGFDNFFTDDLKIGLHSSMPMRPPCILQTSFLFFEPRYLEDTTSIKESLKLLELKSRLVPRPPMVGVFRRTSNKTPLSMLMSLGRWVVPAEI